MLREPTEYTTRDTNPRYPMSRPTKARHPYGPHRNNFRSRVRT